MLLYVRTMVFNWLKQKVQEVNYYSTQSMILNIMFNSHSMIENSPLIFPHLYVGFFFFRRDPAASTFSFSPKRSEGFLLIVLGSGGWTLVRVVLLVSSREGC